MAKVLLTHEEQILKSLEIAYATALSDVKKTVKDLRNSISLLEKGGADVSLINSKIYQLEYQELMATQINSSLDLLRQKNITSTAQFLNKMYNDSYLGDIFNLQQAYKMGVYSIPSPRAIITAITKDTAGLKFSERLYDDVEKLKTNVISEISRGIAQGNSYAEIAARVSEVTEISFNNAYRIARTEGGRVSTEAQIESMRDSTKQGADLLKRWDATLDDKVREVHIALDGETVEIEEYFQSTAGQVFAPHMFGDPAQDINCRCNLASVPRWDSDTNYWDKRNNLTGEILPYKDYEEWKVEYIKMGKS